MGRTRASRIGYILELAMHEWLCANRVLVAAELGVAGGANVRQFMRMHMHTRT